ncbi:BQ5605_C036g11551 [Microbotryum silenes-dioicae]|uniref:BQ5605_C036g11551 protein n=1 Tax=Microbotryum silenes-dioicae TaxID=796604 RepID=A0A2X0PGK5_9BASI|nr:BQ5605_C036g11551 [Microbotryum silenes-dioicae]
MLNFILLQAFEHFNLGRPFLPRRFSRLGHLSYVDSYSSRETGSATKARSVSVQNISKSKERSKRRGRLGPARIGD